MNIHSKNGIRTIKLDKQECRAIDKFTAILIDLALCDPSLDALRTQLAELTVRINGDGVFTPAPNQPEGKQ